MFTCLPENHTDVPKGTQINQLRVCCFSHSLPSCLRGYIGAAGCAVGANFASNVGMVVQRTKLCFIQWIRSLLWNQFCEALTPWFFAHSRAIFSDSSRLVKMSALPFFFMGHNFYNTPHLLCFLLSSLLLACGTFTLTSFDLRELSLAIMEWLVFQLYPNMFAERK